MNRVAISACVPLTLFAIVLALPARAQEFLYLSSGSYTATDNTYKQGFIYVGATPSGKTDNAGNPYVANLNVATNAVVGSPQAFNSSTIHVFDGTVKAATGYDTSQISITGGSVTDVYANNASLVAINGGNVVNANVTDTGTVNVAGGVVQNVLGFKTGIAHVDSDLHGFLMHESSNVRVNNGTVDLGFLDNTSVADITGGMIGQVNAGDSSILNIAGGLVTQAIGAGNSTVNISGGTIAELYTFGSSVSNITGGIILNHTIYKNSLTSMINFYGLSIQFSNAVAGVDPGGQGGVYYDTDWTRPDGVLVSTRLFDAGGSVDNATPRGTTFRFQSATVVPESGALSLLAAGMAVGATLIRRRRR